MDRRRHERNNMDTVYATNKEYLEHTSTQVSTNPGNRCHLTADSEEIDGGATTLPEMMMLY